MAVHAVQAPLIQPQHGRLVFAQGFFGDGNRHKGVAVAIAADPAAEAQKGRNGEGVARVCFAQRVVQAAVDHRRQVEQDLVEEVEPVAHLVQHAWLPQPGFVRLPQRHDLLADPVQRIALFLRGQGREIHPGQRAAIRRSFARMVRRFASVGCAVKTGCT